MKTAVSIVSVLALAAGANAALFVVDLGTGAPPAVIGGYAMTQFGDDPRPIINDVISIGPGDGNPHGVLGFSQAVSHREIGFGWATWSHGYTGDVYYSNGATSLTMFMAPDLAAFSFYVEPNPFAVFDITVTAADGTSITVPVNGSSGANGFGVYGTGGMTVASVNVSSSVDFAVGEFACAAVPAPGAMALAGIAGLVGIRRRR